MHLHLLWHTSMASMAWTIGLIVGGILVCGVGGLKIFSKGPSKAKMADFYKKKTVWVTGSSSGIGKEIAVQAASLGANVVLTGRDPDRLAAAQAVVRAAAAEGAARRHEKLPPAVMAAPPFDMADLAAVERAGEWVREACRVDVLIHNAGVSTRSPALETSRAVEERVMAINFLGPALLTKAVLPTLVSGRGHIACINSVQGLFGIHHRTTYAASKHALRGYFDALRAELAIDKIGVTQVYPGYVNTNLSKNAILGDGKNYGTTDQTTASGMDPSYVASAVLMAVSEGRKEVILADAKTKFACLLRGLAPNLLFKILEKRAKKDMLHKKGSS